MQVLTCGRTLEYILHKKYVILPMWSSNVLLPKVKVKSLSRVRLFVTQWTIAYQVPLSVGFSRQEYWSGLPFPSPGDLPDPGIEPGSPVSRADSLPSEPPGKVSPTLWVLTRVGQAWTEESDRLQSMRSQRVAHNWSNLAQHGTSSGKAAGITALCFTKGPMG